MGQCISVLTDYPYGTMFTLNQIQELTINESLISHTYNYPYISIHWQKNVKTHIKKQTDQPQCTQCLYIYSPASMLKSNRKILCWYFPSISVL